MQAKIGKIDQYILDLVGNAIRIQGNWNASTNDPDITATTVVGNTWVVSVDGITVLGGITDWKVGDMAVKTSTGWIKVDNTEPDLTLYTKNEDLPTVVPANETDPLSLHLDQTTPQTITGLSDGYLKLTSGVVGTGTINTSALVAKTDTKTIKVDGDFYSLYLVSSTKKISPPDLGYGYTITNVKVQCASADPTAEFAGDLKWCDAQVTGAFPSTTPTVIKVLDTTTGNYDSGAITENVATGKELYIQMDSNVDYGVMWTITITYQLKVA